MKFALGNSMRLRRGLTLAGEKGFAVELATWEHSLLVEIDLTVGAAQQNAQS